MTEYNDADWQYEVDSVQRGGVTAKTKARRHGDVSHPNPTDGSSPNDQHDKSGGGSDRFGIPEGI
jgi:hypothetical protein